MAGLGPRPPHSNAGMRTLADLVTMLHDLDRDPRVIEQGGLHNIVKADEYVPAFKAFEERVNSAKGLIGHGEVVSPVLQSEIGSKYTNMLQIDHVKAIADADRVFTSPGPTTFASGGRRTRRRKTKHRKSRRRRVRGGRLEVFKSLEK